jgi:8-amino-7-oxononanoate synthase
MYTTEAIKTWLISYLTKTLFIETEEIDVNLPLQSYGLDSAEALELVGDLEDWLERKLPPNLVEEYSSVATLSQYLSSFSCNKNKKL